MPIPLPAPAPGRTAFYLASPCGRFLRLFTREGHHQALVRFFVARGATWQQTGAGYAYIGPAREMWADLKRDGWRRV